MYYITSLLYTRGGVEFLKPLIAETTNVALHCFDKEIRVKFLILFTVLRSK